MVTAPGDLAGAQTMHRKIRKLLAVSLVRACPKPATLTACPDRKAWKDWQVHKNLDIQKI